MVIILPLTTSGFRLFFYDLRHFRQTNWQPRYKFETVLTPLSTNLRYECGRIYGLVALSTKSSLRMLRWERQSQCLFPPIKVDRSRNGTSFVSLVLRVSRSGLFIDAEVDLSLLDISKDNKLKERRISNSTFLWTDGLINNLNIDAYDNDSVALKACYYVGTIDGFTSTHDDGGMRVWVGTGAETIDQYASLPLSKWVSIPVRWTILILLLNRVELLF